MKNILILLFSTFTLCAFSQISMKIINPEPLKAFGSNLLVQVAIAPYNRDDISVKAAIGNLQAALDYNASTSYYQNSISLADFHEGDTLKLIATATDYLNNMQIDSVMFIYENPREVTYIEPDNFFVATPLLHYKILNKFYDTCKLEIYSGSASMGGDLVPMQRDTLLYSGKIKDSAEGDIDLSGTVNHYIEIVTTEKRGGIIRRVFYINYVTPANNPLLSLVYKGGKNILDLYDKNLLVVDYQRKNPGIVDLGNGHETLIPYSEPLYQAAYATRYGAIFQGGTTIYNWRGGALHQVGPKIYAGYLIASDNYAFWRVNYSPRLMELTTDTVYTLAMDPSFECALGPNGLVAYTEEYTRYDAYFSDVYSYKKKKYTAITKPALNILNQHPVTDGEYIAYTETIYGKSNLRLILYNGQKNLLLSDITGLNEGFNPRNLLRIRNKFVGYCKKGESGEAQVWLRYSLGNNIQVSHLNGSCFPENISPFGEVTFTNGGNLYIYFKNGLTKLASTVLGRTYYFNSAWYTTIGNAVFKINSTIGPVKNIRYGNWSDPSVWSNNRVPDDITAIELDYDITIDANAQCKSLKTNSHMVHVNQNVALVISSK